VQAQVNVLLICYGLSKRDKVVAEQFGQSIRQSAMLEAIVAFDPAPTYVDKLVEGLANF
jgi:hypothetical protein